MRLLLGLMWLLHWLPLPVLGRIGAGVGKLLFIAMRSRRQITLTNLSLCLPELNERERQKIARQHFEGYARSVLERGILWWASPARLRRLIEVDPFVPTKLAAEKPTIFLCPHFVCLEVAGVAITMEGPLCSIYSKQRNSTVFDATLRKAINAGPDTVDAILGELKTAGKVRVDDLVSRGRPAKRIFAAADLGFLL